MTGRTRRGKCGHSPFIFCLHARVNLYLTEHTLQSASEMCTPIVDEERVLWLSVFPRGPLKSACFPPNSSPILFLLYFSINGLWNDAESLQLGRKVRRHKISEGIAIPLNTAPVVNK